MRNGKQIWSVCSVDQFAHDRICSQSVTNQSPMSYSEQTLSMDLPFRIHRHGPSKESARLNGHNEYLRNERAFTDMYSQWLLKHGANMRGRVTRPLIENVGIYI